MPACTEKESNDLQNAGFQGGHRLSSNLPRLRLDMSLINRDMCSLLMEQEDFEIRRRCPSDSSVGSGVSDRTEEDEVDSGDEDFSGYAYTDDDEDTQCIIHCAFCDFELDISATRRRLEEVVAFVPANMVCPVCDEKVGEDALLKLMSNKPLKSEKSSVCSSDSSRIHRRRPAKGNNHEPRADAFLSPFISNASVPNSRGMHAGEDSPSSVSDISNAESLATATGASDMGDEQDHEERRLRVSFVHNLVLSTLF